MNKASLRQILEKLRESLSAERKAESAELLFTHLLKELSTYPSILSFVNRASEIDTSLLNLYLARSGRLLLPRIHQKDLQIYRVEDPQSQLTKTSFGLLEPQPTLCQKVGCEEIGAILVPALGFDRENHRLGYGKGYYDRFLSHLPHIPTYGVGFKEQQVDTLPIDPHDIPVTHLYLF